MHNSASPKTRQGDWIQTFSGQRFYPFDPRAEEISLADIAHSLSNQCRFAGHCRDFYSVAQHSVLVSYNCDPEDALWGLLHDAAEAYLIDLPRPVKRHPDLYRYRAAEVLVLVEIAKAFNLPVAVPLSVKYADEAMLATEARDLMAPMLFGWTVQAQPYKFTIDPWPPGVACGAFLQRFNDLVGKR